MARKSKLLVKSLRLLRRRKLLVLICALTAICVATVHLTRPTTAASFIGRWRAVGGSEVMVFTGNGGMEVTESGGTHASPGSYALVDAEHLSVEFAFGSPRLIHFSPNTTEMAWTNHQEGIVLRYRKELGSSLKVRANTAFGL